MGWMLLGCVGTSPRPDGAGTEPVTEAVSDASEAEVVLYGTSTLDVSLTLSDGAIAELPLSDSDPSHPVPATFRVGDASYAVGLELKGGKGSFRPFDQKPSFRLDFAQYERGGSFAGERFLVLNNLVQDLSMLGEHAAYFSWRAAGVPASRHGFARVTVNGEPYGLYGIVEDVRGDFLDRAWPGDADGPLLYGRGDLVPGDEHTFDVVVGDGRHPLHDMVNDLADASDADFWGTLSDWFDTDALLREWAVDIATGNPDTYGTRHNNYYVAWRDGAGRWSMIPWGPDVAFTEALPLADDGFQGALYQRCTATAECRAELEDRLAQVADWWETGALEAEMRSVADRTEEDCASDPRSEAGPGGCDIARDAFFAFLHDRPAELRALVP